MATLAQALPLAKSQTGAALAALLGRVLRSRDAFDFGELLDLPSVRALAASEHKPSHDLLVLFAQGTYAQWKANRAAYPELDAALLDKLRVLTIVSIASARKVIPYGLLMAELDAASPSELEQLVIQAVYSGLVHARMDQREQVVEVSRCAGRDVRAHDAAYLAELLAKLTAWSGSVASAMDAVQSQMSEVALQREAAARAREIHAKKVEDGRRLVEMEIAREFVHGGYGGGAAAALGPGWASMGGGGGGGAQALQPSDGGGLSDDATGGAMDVDEDDGQGRRRPKRRMPTGGAPRPGAAPRRL